jgi:nicotinamide-nucleotide amidase
MLTRIPGSSQGFHAGFVTYSNAIKQSVLGVNAQTLTDNGAVSEDVVREMALGALQRSEADYAIAVSGIAGPDGGTEEKPVGTVWLAWGDRHTIRTRSLVWPVDRALFQTMLAAAGLDMMRRFLLGIDAEPRYFAQRQAR